MTVHAANLIVRSVSFLPDFLTHSLREVPQSLPLLFVS